MKVCKSQQEKMPFVLCVRLMFTIMTNCVPKTYLQFSRPEVKIYATLKLCTRKVKRGSNVKAWELKFDIRAIIITAIKKGMILQYTHS